MTCPEVDKETGRECDQPGPCYIQHWTDGEGWGVAPDPPKRGAKSKQADEIAERIEQPKPVGPPNVDPPKSGAEGKQEGMERVERAASEEWKHDARVALHALALERPHLTSEDLEELVPVEDGVDHRIWGTITAWGARQGLIEKGEQVVSRFPRRNNGNVQQWISLVHRAEVGAREVAAS